VAIAIIRFLCLNKKINPTYFHMPIARLTCLFLISIFLLNACAPAAFVAGATVGGAVVYDKRPLNAIKEDFNTGNQIDDMINQLPDDVQNKTHIVSNVFNGIVLLAGQAPEASVVASIAAETRALPHVRRVYNKVQIKAPSSLAQRSKDTWLATKIRAKLLATKGLSSTQISILVEDRVVYLMGMVSRSQASMATNVIRKETGVKKVVKLFEYTK
jgi:osmotically-inducible protein OsmY